MTRRIGWAVLLTCWATLLCAAGVIYWSVRASVLDQLDRSIVDRAALLLSHAHDGSRLPPPPDDRFIVKNEKGQTIARPDPLRAAAEPAILSRTFTIDAEGKKLRTLSLQFASESSAGGGLTVVYSASAAEYERLQKRLLWTVLLTIAVGCAATFFIAQWMSRIVTRPLKLTASTIGEVDEWHLDRRIETAHLPEELKPVGERLNLMLTRLQEAFLRQRQFLADSAHELRTPVAALRTGIEVALLRERSPAELKEVLQRSLTSAERLSDLVLQLLDVARTGQQSAEPPTQIDIKRFLQDRITELQGVAEESGVNLQADLAENLGEMPLPRRSFSTVITNLVENAVRHTGRGGSVRVTARMNDHLSIEITDTGCGIAPEHLVRIFEPFYQVDNSRKNATGHLGLGLYLVRLSVIRMGGRIECRSEVGKGTTFAIALPANADPSQTGRSVAAL